VSDRGQIGFVFQYCNLGPSLTARAAFRNNDGWAIFAAAQAVLEVGVVTHPNDAIAAGVTLVERPKL
jgi:hypothetical protein